jgi:signal transduction histidine kinase
VLTVAVVDGAAARAVRSLEETQTILVGLASILAVVGLAAVGIGAGIGVLAVRRSTIPLEDVADAMRALSRGESGDVPEAKPGAPREVVDVVQATATLQESLRRSQEQQEQLVQDAGHELRTPLNGIIGMTELTLESGLDSPANGLREEAFGNGPLAIAETVPQRRKPEDRPELRGEVGGVIGAKHRLRLVDEFTVDGNVRNERHSTTGDRLDDGHREALGERGRHGRPRMGMPGREFLVAHMAEEPDVGCVPGDIA